MINIPLTKSKYEINIDGAEKRRKLFEFEEILYKEE